MLDQEDGILVATIGKVHLALPLALEKSLSSLIGQRISLLKTDLADKPFLFRVLTQTQSEREVVTNENKLNKRIQHDEQNEKAGELVPLSA